MTDSPDTFCECKQIQNMVHLMTCKVVYEYWIFLIVTFWDFYLFRVLFYLEWDMSVGWIRIFHLCNAWHPSPQNPFTEEDEKRLTGFIIQTQQALKEAKTASKKKYVQEEAVTASGPETHKCNERHNSTYKLLIPKL